ncbi:hypothetical protein [uncultured Anaerococcus sp.]|uniref:hypothetical protein n=1 Tax=uncultured Anaerococcus sp. TaxID=293428 RepID=UPI002602B437|nr:hypothetical protein [uncultured Anaerococcus sp.]
MAFKRKERKVISFDFEYEGLNDTRTLHYETEHSLKLSEDLQKIFNLASNAPEGDIDTLREKFIKAYDLILGPGAMADIQKYVYKGDELLYTDLLDIGYYMMEEINKANKLITKEYGYDRVNKILSDDTTNTKKEKLYTASDIAKILNAKNNGLPN